MHISAIFFAPLLSVVLRREAKRLIDEKFRKRKALTQRKLRMKSFVSQQPLNSYGASGP